LRIHLKKEHTVQYAWEKFHGAVLTLAGQGDQRDRLANAYLFDLMHVDTSTLPQGIRGDFEMLKETLASGTPEADEGTVVAAVKAMDEFQMHELVEKIVSMYDTIARHQEPRE